jgi:hypothetical protein
VKVTPKETNALRFERCVHGRDEKPADYTTAQSQEAFSDETSSNVAGENPTGTGGKSKYDFIRSISKVEAKCKI